MEAYEWSLFRWIIQNDAGNRFLAIRFFDWMGKTEVPKQPDQYDLDDQDSGDLNSKPPHLP